jgi:rare lipoprotein A
MTPRTQLAMLPARLAERALPVCGLALSALLTAGCHHQQAVAYQPPPPPIYRRPIPAPLPADTSASLPVKPPAGVPYSPPGADDTSGKPVFTEFGVASWYGPPYHNHTGADGTVFDQNALTAAHRTLPMGSTVRVTNVATGQNIVVRVTDRGPFVPGRVLDLSKAAAQAIGVWRPGTAEVKIEAFAHPNPDPAGRWCVQIGAFKSSDDALDVKAELMRRFTTAKVIEFTGPTGHWVRVNPALPDLAHANEVARSLESPDPDALPYVVRLD